MGSFIRLKYLRRFIGVVALVLALVLAMTVIAPLCVPGTTKGRGFDARSIEAQLENLEEIKLLVGDRVLSEPEIEYLERMVRFCFQDRLRSLMQTDPRVRKELRQPRPRQQAPRVRVVAKALSLIGQLGRPGDPRVREVLQLARERAADAGVAAAVIMACASLRLDHRDLGLEMRSVQDTPEVRMARRTLALSKELAGFSESQRRARLGSELRSAVQDATWAVAVARLACQFCDPSSEFLDRLASDSREEVRAALAHYLLYSGSKASERLIRLLEDESVTVRLYAVKSLSVVGRARCKSVLTRKQATWFGPTPISRVLEKLAPKERRQAERRFRKMVGDEWDKGEIIRIETSVERELWDAVRIATLRIDFNAAPAKEKANLLFRAIVDGQPPSLGQACEIAAKAAPEAVLDELMKLAATETNVKRRGKMHTGLRSILQGMPSERAKAWARKQFEATLALMRSDNWRHRSAGVQIAGYSGYAGFVPQLIPLLDDPFVWKWKRGGQEFATRTVVNATIHALELIRDPRAIKPLAQVFGRSIESPDAVESAALRALRAINDPSAVPFIETRLDVMRPKQQRIAENVIKWLKRERKSQGTEPGSHATPNIRKENP